MARICDTPDTDPRTGDEFRYRPEAFVLDPKDDGGDPTGPPLDYVQEAYARGAIPDDDLDDEIERALRTETPGGLTWNDDGRVRAKMESVRKDGGGEPLLEGQRVMSDGGEPAFSGQRVGK